MCILIIDVCTSFLGGSVCAVFEAMLWYGYVPLLSAKYEVASLVDVDTL